MVHRPADSRLLSNLLQQEKDYLKHFNQLLNSSAASLQSVTAYAAASPPPASHVILTVAGLLADADDALKRYAFGIEQWRDAMELLKKMEDDVGNIMRDREILVTRLIKVSKSHKSNSGTFRDSLLLGNHQSSSSLSLSNHDSPPSRPVSVSFPTSTKLAAAQSELQACETHLASKESELSLKRSAAVREGLTTRAKAMIDCSWAWGQLGKKILHSLDSLGNVQVRGNEHEYSMSRHIPEADSTRPSSDFSSIGPSQSASQIDCNGQQLPEPIITPSNRMLGRPINGNMADAQQIPASADPTLPRPNSTASSVPSSLAMPTTYKLETVTYAPARAIVVPGKDELSSSPLGFGSNSSGPSLPNTLRPSPAAALTSYAPVTEELSKDQGLHTRMHVPAAYAINEYEMPTAEVAGFEAETTAWRHSRGESQEGSNQIGYSIPQPQPWRSLASSGSEPILFDSNAMCSNMPTSNSTINPQRHRLERKITEEELQGNSSSAVDLSRGSGQAGSSKAVVSALVEVFDDPENGNDQEEEEDELPIEAEDQLIQQGKLAVIENPKFMSEERKRELERERIKVAGAQEGQEQDSKPQTVREKTRFPFLHQHPKRADTQTSIQGQSQSQSQSNVPFASASISTSTAPSTPKTSPLKTGDFPYNSPSKTSPSKRFLGSLRGLFGARQPVSPSQVQNSSPSPSKLDTRKQDSSPSRIRSTDDSDADADEDSDEDSPTKAGRGLQALFRGNGVKKKSGSAGGAGWSTRTDKNIRKLTRAGEGHDDDDGYVSLDVGRNPHGIAGNAVVKAGLVDPEGSIGAGLSATRKRSASDIGNGVPAVGGSTTPKVSAGGGKRLKKTFPPPSAAASASALYTSPQRSNTIGASVHSHTSSPSTPMGQSSLSLETKPATQGKRSASVDEGPRRVNGVQGGEVGQTPVGGGGGGKGVLGLGNRRKRAVSDNAGPPLSGNSSAITTTNNPIGTPTRGIPAAGTSASKGYSSDTATTAVSAPLTKKKSVVKNGGPGPAAASVSAAVVPAATSVPAATAATVTPTAATTTPTRKTSIGKVPNTTPNIPTNNIDVKAGGSRQPYTQPQPHHQHPTSHFVPSSSGGATVLAAGGTHPSGTLISHPGWDTQALPTAGGGLSRNSSLLGAASAPTSSGGSGMSKTKKQKETVLGHGMGSGTSLGRRSSLGSSSGHAEAGAGSDGKGEKKKATNVAAGGSSTGVVQPSQPVPSLMSIVEDVAKHNREWSQESSQLLKNRNKIAGKEKIGSVGMVDVVKAPPRIGRDELAQLDPTTIRDRVMEIGAVTSASGGSGSGPRLVDIKAPGSVFDQRKTKNVVPEPVMQTRMHRQASNSTPNLTESQQTYHANLTRRASVTATSTTRPAKSPLRSALKSHSRTPSPLPGPFLVPHLQKQQQQQQAPQQGSHHSVKSNVAMVAPVPVSHFPLSSILGPVTSPQPSQTQSTSTAAAIRPAIDDSRRASYGSTSQRRKDKVKTKADEVIGGSGDAGDSTSTNDTGDEVFYTDDDEGHQSEGLDNQAVRRASPMLNGHAVGYTVVGGSSEHSHSTTSTAVHRPPPASASQPTTPQRRKSVRVSLQPTFSPSPPAIEYDDEEEQKHHAPWAWKQDHHDMSGGQHVHAPVPLAARSPLLAHQPKVAGPEQTARVHDIWEDSSDEDVEYQKAKRLLKRAKKKEEDMHVFVVGSRL